MNSKLQEIEDYEAIKATMQKYIDGVANHDSALLSEAFHPEGQMNYHFADQFSLVPAASKITEYMDSIPPVRETSPGFGFRFLSIESYGTAAAVKLGEDDIEGLYFITYFHLHKIDGEWLITSKATAGGPLSD